MRDIKHGGDTRKWKWEDGRLINRYSGGSLRGNGRTVSQNNPGQWILDYNSRIIYFAAFSHVSPDLGSFGTKLSIRVPKNIYLNDIFFLMTRKFFI